MRNLARTKQVLGVVLMQLRDVDRAIGNVGRLQRRDEIEVRLRCRVDERRPGMALLSVGCRKRGCGLGDTRRGSAAVE